MSYKNKIIGIFSRYLQKDQPAIYVSIHFKEFSICTMDIKIDRSSSCEYLSFFQRGEDPNFEIFEKTEPEKILPTRKPKGWRFLEKKGGRPKFLICI